MGGRVSHEPRDCMQPMSRLPTIAQAFRRGGQGGGIQPLRDSSLSSVACEDARPPMVGSSSWGAYY